VSINDWVIKQFLKLNSMLKNILKLNSAKQLSKNEQKSIQGSGKKVWSLCMAAVEYCSGERVYDPCGPTTQTNYPC
jgi:hypothetical protein